jgi:hypothetical protein
MFYKLFTILGLQPARTISVRRAGDERHMPQCQA